MRRFLIGNKLVFDFFVKKISLCLHLCKTVFRFYPNCLKRSSKEMFYSFVGSSLLVCQMYNSINEKRTPSKNCYA